MRAARPGPAGLTPAFCIAPGSPFLRFIMRCFVLVVVLLSACGAEGAGDADPGVSNGFAAHSEGPPPDVYAGTTETFYLHDAMSVRAEPDESAAGVRVLSRGEAVALGAKDANGWAPVVDASASGSATCTGRATPSARIGRSGAGKERRGGHLHPPRRGSTIAGRAAGATRTPRRGASGTWIARTATDGPRPAHWPGPLPPGAALLRMCFCWLRAAGETRGTDPSSDQYKLRPPQFLLLMKSRSAARDHSPAALRCFCTRACAMNVDAPNLGGRLRRSHPVGAMRGGRPALRATRARPRRRRR